MRVGRVGRRLAVLGAAVVFAVQPATDRAAAAPAAPAGPAGPAVHPGGAAAPAAGAGPLEAPGPSGSAVGPLHAAMDELDRSAPGTRLACAPDAPGVPCVRTRLAGSAAVEAAPAGGVLAAGTRPPVVTGASPFGSLVGSWSPLCTGTGSDGRRVQAVYAYDPAWGPPDATHTDAVRRAMVDADLTFSQSAAKTGGQRRVRWVTDSGSAGCQLRLLVVPVTAGLDGFDDLVDELVGDGVISGSLTSGVKYLIWTEGALDAANPSTCGLGESFTDDTPGPLENLNRHTAYAAVVQPCWDVDGGGSVPAHELMHTLGAVQPSAPHYDGRGHCTDDHDNMCYGPSTVPVDGCTDAVFGEARFDCNDDDYFNTAPPTGSYLCRAWNTARSPYLEGWGSGLEPVGVVPSLWVTPSEGRLLVQWTAPSSCPGPSGYRVEVSGWGSVDVAASVLAYQVSVAPGDRTVTVTPYRDGRLWPAQARSVVASSVASAEPPPPPPPNRLPVGGIVLSLNRGSDYGLLAWAIDPETGAPPRMRVTVEGVSSRELEWNYSWTDMASFTGVEDTRALVYLAQLPRGTRDVCVDALDPQGGGWAGLGCRSHTVK